MGASTKQATREGSRWGGRHGRGRTTMNAPQPPAGWYPELSGRPRYWDGTRWAAPPPRRSNRAAGWIVAAVVAVVAVLATCAVLATGVVGDVLGPGQDEIRRAADDVRIPPQLTLVDERW